MARTSLERLRVWQLLAIGLSIAVTFVAGWLVLTVLFSGSGSEHDIRAMTMETPLVGNQRISETQPLAAPRQSLSPQADPGNWPEATGALALAAPPPAALPVKTILVTAPAASHPSMASAEVTKSVAEAPTDPPEFVPLPLPRPRHSVPLPRSRPQIAEQAQADPPTFFDFLTGRAR
jgi:hypothetical protein